MATLKNTKIMYTLISVVILFLTLKANGEIGEISTQLSDSQSGGCCLGTTGNIDADVNGDINIADLTFLIDHLFITFIPLPCQSAANIDGSADSLINIADVTFLIDHLFLTLIPLTSCQASYASDVRPILNNWCAVPGCHGGGSSSGGFTMGAGAPYSTVRNAVGIFGGAIIVAGDASSSTLYSKTTSSPPFGSRMPQGGPFLTTEQQNLIRDWINQGAIDN